MPTDSTGNIHEVLKRYWGYDTFRELQEEIITSVLDGNDTLGLLPTGGGKSITFQVPTLSHDGMTIVVTPIISLMKDQVDNLVAKGIKATYVHSGLSLGEIRRTLDKCTFGNYKFLYISPERIASQSFIDKMRFMPVKLIVVDEAHCISQWGYDFRPSFLNIAQIREYFPSIPMLALTATATPDVVADIMDKLKFSHGKVFSKSFARKNLVYVVRQTDDKVAQLVSILQKVPGSGIVYVRSRARTKQIAEELNRHGIVADFYHAGLENTDKSDRQNKWKSGQTRVMVATNAFGMGIDKPDVRLVAHIDIPGSLEEYYQEAGRAGRDGKKAFVVMLTKNTDKAILKKRISDSFPDKEFIRKVYERVGNFLNVPVEGGFNQVYDFNFTLFCKTFKYPVIPVLSALKILTKSGYIDFIEEIDTQSRVIILAKKEELYHLPGDNPDLDRVLQAILRTYSGLFSDYVFINEELISFRFKIPPQVIYESLLTLTKMHILHYVPRKRTPYIYYTTSREQTQYITIPRSAYEVLREKMTLRIDEVIKYAFSDDMCREQIIRSYFGETDAAPCGHCDYCIALKQRNRYSGKEVVEGITYMLSQKPRTMPEFLDTLSFSKNDIACTLSSLTDEGIVNFDPERGTYTLAKK